MGGDLGQKRRIRLLEHTENGRLALDGGQNHGAEGPGLRLVGAQLVHDQQPRPGGAGEGGTAETVEIRRRGLPSGAAAAEEQIVRRGRLRPVRREQVDGIDARDHAGDPLGVEAARRPVILPQQRPDQGAFPDALDAGQKQMLRHGVPSRPGVQGRLTGRQMVRGAP